MSNDAQLILSIAICVLLFSGDPDVVDALVIYLTK